MWCCVGSGMENHTKYGEAIYFHSGDDLYVNLFIPSALAWKERGLALEQQTDYPRGNTTRLVIASAPASPLAIRVRCPGWASGPVSFELNGRRLGVTGTPGTYAAVRRVWVSGDVLAVTIPMAVRSEPMPGATDKVAFLYVKAVLAADPRAGARGPDCSLRRASGCELRGRFRRGPRPRPGQRPRRGWVYTVRGRKPGLSNSAARTPHRRDAAPVLGNQLRPLHRVPGPPAARRGRPQRPAP